MAQLLRSNDPKGLNIFDLPELLEIIFSYLAKDKSLYPTLFVNRLWYHCSAPIIWSKVVLNGEKSRHFTYLNYNHKRLKRFIKAIREESMPFYGSNLKYLEIAKYHNLSNRKIRKIIQVCPNIVHLDLNFSKGFNDTALIGIAHSYPNLKHLNIRNNKEITDFSISEIARSCCNMKYLNISFCKRITDKSIHAIAKSCYRLEFLYIAGLKYINESIAYLSPNIRYLDLACCYSITNGVIGKIAQLCPNLEYLNLSGCENITDVPICDIAHYCQKLEHFDICGCDISDLAIENIASLCFNLKFLNIQLCEGISENAVKMLNPNIKVKGIDRFNNYHIANLAHVILPQLRTEQINELIAEVLHQSYTHDSING